MDSPTPNLTLTACPACTFTVTGTPSPSSTATGTQTSTPTGTETASNTPTPSPSATATSTAPDTFTATATPTLSATETVLGGTPTPNLTLTACPACTFTATETPTDTATPTDTLTFTAYDERQHHADSVRPPPPPTGTATVNGTATASPSATPSATSTLTPWYRYSVDLQVFDASGHEIADLGMVPSISDPSALVLSVGTLFADGTAKVQVTDSCLRLEPGLGRHHLQRQLRGAGSLPAARHLHGLHAGGATSVKQATLSVVPVSGHLGDSLVAVPNPADGSRPMELRWTPTSRASLVTARVYNLAAELVFSREVAASAGDLSWSLRSPNGLPITDGVYLWDIEVRDDSNRVVERIVRKVAVLRH